MMNKNFVFIISLIFLSCALYAQQTAQPTESDFQNFISDTVDTINNVADAFIRTGSVTVTAASSGVTLMFAALSTGSCEPAPVFFDYLELTILALIIVIFAEALIYMIGQIFQMPNLIVFVKNESITILFTIINVLVIIGIITSGNYFYKIVTSNIPPTDPVYYGKDTYIDAAIAFTRLMVAEISKNYTAMVLFNTLLHIFYTATMYVGTNFRSMYNFNLGTALKPFIDLVSIGLQSMGLALGEWLAQGILLCFIKKWSWSLFIPLSIFLRAFPQTRQVGVALFSLMIALLIMYPIMFIIMYETHKLLQPYLVDNLEQLKDIVAKSGVFGLTGMALAFGILGGGALIPLICGVIAVGTYDLLRNSVYYVVIMGAVLPFFSVFITLTYAREIAGRLGAADVNYMSFLKII